MKYRHFPSYKDSGVEWLGNVPEHWEVVPLKVVSRVQNGATPPSEDSNWDGEIKWVTPPDLTKAVRGQIIDTARKISPTGLASCGTRLVPEGSVILSCRAPIGSVGVAHDEMCFNQGCKSLTPFDNGYARFLYYRLLCLGDVLNAYGSGTTFIELGSDELKSIKIAIPPPNEVNSVGVFLDRETTRIDALIEKKQRLIELLKEKRQAVITQAVTKGLDPNVPMKDSGVEWLGEVPEHWGVYTISRLFRERVEKGGEERPILSVSIHYGVTDKELLQEESDRKLQRMDSKDNYKRVNAGDLVYNMMRAWQGAFGASTIDGLVSPAYVVAEPSREIVS